MYAVIMAGGSGTRLWPMSRKGKPKQLQQLIGDRTMLEDTYDRLFKITSPDQIYIATVRDYKEQIQAILPQIPEDHFFIEPELKNTGPAIGIIAAYFAAKDPGAIVGTFASDHIVQDTGEFTQVVNVAKKVISEHRDYLMVIGLKPTFPDIGKGYIELDSNFETVDDVQVYRANRFVEKPDLKTAEKFVKSWRYLWNASYFIWDAKTMLEWFKKYEPVIFAGLETIKKSVGKKSWPEAVNKAYKKFPSIAIEYAITERVKKILVIPADLGWSDIGAWDTLHDVLRGMTGHHMIVKGHHVGHDDQDCLIFAQDKMIATVGLKDVIIIETPDVILIANKQRSQDIKHLLDKLKEQGKHLYL